MKKTVLLIFASLIPAITRAQWSAPVDLSPNAISAGLNESMGTCVGVAGDTVHAVWTDKLSTTKAALYYTRSVDTGETWSTPIAITNLNGNAWNPTIAVNGSNVHVVWREINPANNRRASYYMHSLNGGNTWSSELFLDSTADWPAISVERDTVYVANDVLVSNSPYNTEIFFLRSLDNGFTWSPRKQLTFSVGRSEDEAIYAQGSHVHMSWNDNRSGLFQILYKESSDYGVTWDSDVVVMPKKDYSTMVYADGKYIDVVATGHPTSNHYQLLFVQSADTGATWAADKDISNNDTTNTYYYPDMVRSGQELHVVCGSSTGEKYYHSSDGGTNWDPPFTYSGGFTFVAHTGCVVHIICADSGHIHYLRNPIGNGSLGCGFTTGIGMPANGADYGVEIYPNPVDNTVTVKSANKLSLITIYNSLGQLIYIKNTADDRQQIDLTNQPAGIYFLQIGEKHFKIVKE